MSICNLIIKNDPLAILLLLIIIIIVAVIILLTSIEWMQQICFVESTRMSVKYKFLHITRKLTV